MLASATIANPVELAERLTGCEVALVDRDGAPRAERRIAMWNPPLVDERTGARASPLAEAADLLADLVERGVRTICFLRSRRGIELILKFARLRLEERGRADLAELIAPYRAGLHPRAAAGDRVAAGGRGADGRGGHGRPRAGHRRGRLDAAICVTFPGTVASLRQMWGRAGRRDTGLAVYVAGADALDQFFCRHPEEFLARPVESAILDHESEEIHLAHLCAAAYEMPLSPGDQEFLGERWEPAARRLVKMGLLRERAGRYLPRGEEFPAGRIALRSASPDSVAVVEAEGGEVIGTVETARAHSVAAPRRGLPAHGALVRGRGSRSRVAARARQALLRRLVHPAEEGHRHLHRGSRGRPRGGAAPRCPSAGSRSPSRSRPSSASG